jgi:hypothetical protein
MRLRSTLLLVALSFFAQCPFQVLAGLNEGSVIEFNEAFAESIVFTIKKLMVVPWSRVLNIMSAGFDSR